MRRDRLTVAAGIAAAIAVAAGAFGAHGADGRAAEWLRTGTAYLLPHAVAALAVAPIDRRVAWLLLGGGGLFAATLYAMALGAPRVLGAVTPLGGAAMIAGWLWLAFRAR